MLGLQIPVQVFSVSLLFFYTDVKRLPAAWSATAFTLYAIYNAVNNPLIGYLSDRTKARWGRRFAVSLVWDIALADRLCLVVAGSLQRQ
ncbi:MAG: MFS transporter [Caldilineaceae bacterium]